MNNNSFSVLTVTNRSYCINNLIKNYLNQSFDKKELIIIINNDSVIIEDFFKFSTLYNDIYIYKLSQKTSLGECLNYGITKCTNDFIAKFDDDDYYGPFYLNEMHNIFLSLKCDIVGKYKTYYYLEKYNKLILKNSLIENQYTSSIMGSTLCSKKSIFNNIRFRDLSRREDFYFNQDCCKKGYKIFASSCFNHIVFKHADNIKHTFYSDIDILMSKCTEIKSNVLLEDCFDIVNKQTYLIP
ncbi:glycosyltransferase family 2 protein [Romboutsia sp.]|uniref:glycosyltransferase family 2 protein n=1 Tax=Romboutsia sp. TaxID=1965302 RepID=UPI003F405609